MLRISDTQLTVLGADRVTAFFGRARAFIAARLKIDVADADIERLYERGQAYGLRSEQDFVRYMFVAVALKAVKLDDDPEWMRTILDVRTPAVDLKLRRLFEEAARRLPPGVVATAGA